MTDLAALWLPILLAAVFVFVVSSVLHMALPIHASDYGKLPDEDKTRAALRDAKIPPGQYMFPCAGSMKEWGSPEMDAKLNEGPVGIMMVRPNGRWGMGPSLLTWFSYSLLVSVFCGYLAGLHLAPGAEGLTVFRVTGTIAVLGYVFAQYHEWTWKGLSTGVMLKFVFDGVLYALATAAAFAWLWPAAA